LWALARGPVDQEALMKPNGLLVDDDVSQAQSVKKLLTLALTSLPASG
jgi:hypothetical protein